jgi:hypothetical protein
VAFDKEHKNVMFMLFRDETPFNFPAYLAIYMAHDDSCCIKSVIVTWLLQLKMALWCRGRKAYLDEFERIYFEFTIIEDYTGRHDFLLEFKI